MTENEVREILKGEFTIDIPNFEKWNPPLKDRKTGMVKQNQFRSYITLSVHTFDDPKFHGLTNSERHEWLLLCLRRATNGPLTCQRSANVLPTICHRRASRVPALILKLLERQLITLSILRKKERNTKCTTQTPNGGGEKAADAASFSGLSEGGPRKKKSPPMEPDPEFELAWKTYPRSRFDTDKAGAQKKWSGIPAADRPRVMQAIKSCALFYKLPAKGFRPNPKYLSRFLKPGAWEPWEHGPPNTPKKETINLELL